MQAMWRSLMTWTEILSSHLRSKVWLLTSKMYQESKLGKSKSTARKNGLLGEILFKSIGKLFRRLKRGISVLQKLSLTPCSMTRSTSLVIAEMTSGRTAVIQFLRSTSKKNICLKGRIYSGSGKRMNSIISYLFVHLKTRLWLRIYTKMLFINQKKGIASLSMLQNSSKRGSQS